MADNKTDNVASLIELAGDITIAWLGNPNVNPSAQDVPAFLKDLHAAIAGLGAETVGEPEPVAYEPAVSPRSSVKPDHIVSLIDGKKYKTLKRHLALNGLTPGEYRARYGLKPDYPMVASAYAAQRREIAKKLGLGRKSGAKAEPAVDAESVPEVPVAAKPAPKWASAKTRAKAAVTDSTVPAVATPETVEPAAPKRKGKAAPAPESIPASASKAEKKVTANAKRAPAKEKAAPPSAAPAKPKRTPRTKAASKPDQVAEAAPETAAEASSQA